MPVLPTNVQDGAAPGVGFGGGGRLLEELEPPPQAAHTISKEIERLSRRLFFMRIGGRFSWRESFLLRI
jgi:hypothetical protein